MNALMVRFIQVAFPRASIDCLRIEYPVISPDFLPVCVEISFFTTVSSVASEGNNLRVIWCCKKKSLVVSQLVVRIQSTNTSYVFNSQCGFS